MARIDRAAIVRMLTTHLEAQVTEGTIVYPGEEREQNIDKWITLGALNLKEPDDRSGGTDVRRFTMQIGCNVSSGIATQTHYAIDSLMSHVIAAFDGSYITDSAGGTDHSIEVDAASSLGHADDAAFENTGQHAGTVELVGLIQRVAGTSRETFPAA